MKRIIIISILLLAALSANAQRVNGQFGGYFQFGKGGKDMPQESLPSGGIFVGAQLEPIYPWPIYLETGLGFTIGSGNKGTADVYRLELPLSLTWQWEPAPNFSIGPYGGVYGVYHLRAFLEERHHLVGVQCYVFFYDVAISSVVPPAPLPCGAGPGGFQRSGCISFPGCTCGQCSSWSGRSRCG